ncbi:MAG: D-alanyl-D-alanine carboxypeptidase family protein [Anaerovoracaceae bacterium]
MRKFFIKRKKIIFISAAIFSVIAGMLIYNEKFGAVSTSSSNIEVSAGQAILIDGDTGTVLYEKAADERAYPASTTKIMTALITLETLDKYNSPIEQKVKIPKEAAGVEGSSLYLAEGEQISIEDLLYGLMLVSGNDSAVALSCIIGGTQERFIDMMNKKAEKLGCSNTHFANPNGLFDENHYTTVRDMAAIAREAMKDKTFRKIVSAKEWKADRKTSDYLTFRNKNKTVHQFEGGNGIKIGYTKSSGRTLVASAQRDGKNLICVVMSAPDWFNDAYRLMEYGFEVL